MLTTSLKHELRVMRGIALMQFRDDSKYPIKFLKELVTAGISLLTIYFMSGLVDSQKLLDTTNVADYMQFAMVGYMVSIFVGHAAQSVDRWLMFFQRTGVLEDIWITQKRIWTFSLYLSVYPLCLVLLKACAYLSAASLLFRIRVDLLSWSAVLITFCLISIAFLGIACLGTGYRLLFHRGNPITGAIILASTLLSGVFYPVKVLPEFLQDLAQLLPLTHALDAIRYLLFTGGSVASLLPPLIGLALISSVLLPIGIASITLADRFARREGVLNSH